MRGERDVQRASKRRRKAEYNNGAGARSFPIRTVRSNQGYKIKKARSIAIVCVLISNMRLYLQLGAAALPTTSIRSSSSLRRAFGERSHEKFGTTPLSNTERTRRALNRAEYNENRTRHLLAQTVRTVRKVTK